jgi:AraC-like DNA-binding protein
MGRRFDDEDWEIYAAQCMYSITRMAEGKRMSRQHLRRQFLQSLGTSPKEWIENQRTEAAIRLLGAGKSVKEVAIELGFSNSSHFGRFFHRKTGYSPRQFQEMFPRGYKCSAGVIVSTSVRKAPPSR